LHIQKRSALQLVVTSISVPKTEEPSFLVQIIAYSAKLVIL